MLTVGSLCSGYGGLELGLGLAGVDHTLAFVCDVDKAANAVLAQRFPGTPNIGDLRSVDWRSLPAVDLLAAGFPCQPVSAAGKRAGIADERWLFDDIADGIGAMGRARPRVLWFENVPGLLSANRGHAMARVVHRLAALGYVGRYRLLRASDVGAPHRRERVFIAARLAHTPSVGLRQRRPTREPGLSATALAGGIAALLPTPTTREGKGPGRLDGNRNDTLRAQIALLKTPTAGLGLKGAGQHPDLRKAGGHGPTLADEVEHLLPTPAASRYGSNQSPSPGAAVRPGLDAIGKMLPTPRSSDGDHSGPNQRGSKGDLALSAAALLLPTPTAVDAKGARNATSGRRNDSEHHTGWTLGDVAYTDRWGHFAAAIARWECVVGRPAPAPTEPSAKAAQRLSARFVEWMLGLPPGHVCDVPGLSRNEQLRLLGNGVVPQQSAAAAGRLLDSRTWGVLP